MKSIMRLALLCIAMVGAIASTPVRAHGDEPHGKAAEVQSSIPEVPEGHSTPLDPVSANAGENQVQEPHPAIATLTMHHPATTHFPIALLLVAAALEIWLIVRPKSDLEQSIRILLYCAAAGTIIAALFGWIHTEMWLGGEVLMRRHRWVGTGLGFRSFFAAALRTPVDEKIERRQH